MLNPVNNISTQNDSRNIFTRLKQIMLRRVWLPKPLYASLPFIYIGLGLYATYAAMFTEHWSWVVPYFLLLACACLHAGILTATLRIRAWRRYQERRTRTHS